MDLAYKLMIIYLAWAIVSSSGLLLAYGVFMGYYYYKYSRENQMKILIAVTVLLLIAAVIVIVL